MIALSLLTNVSCFTIKDLLIAEIWYPNTPLLKTCDLYETLLRALPKISSLLSFCMKYAAHHNEICLSRWHSPFPCVDRIRFPALGNTFRLPDTRFSACGAKLRMYRCHRGPTRDQPVPAIKIRIMMKSPSDCSSIHGGTAWGEGGKWKVWLSSWGEGRQGPNFQLLPSEFHKRRGLRSTNGSSLVPINRFSLQRSPITVNKFLQGHRDSTNSSPSSSPSDSTLSLKFDGKQFIGLLTHRNLPLWFPDYAIADGILTIKLERLRKLLQHMDLYLRLSPA